MLTCDLAEMPGLETLEPGEPERLIEAGYTSDLLSDVMARAPQDSVLITIQAHGNTVAVSALAGVAAIIICNHRDVPPDMLEAAREEGIAVFRTRDNQFKTSCRVHACLCGE